MLYLQWTKRTGRLDTLGPGYTQADLQMMFEKPEVVSHARSERGFDLIIDIQKKIAEGKGKGYENWATIYNIKQIADTLIFLKENGVTDYDDLVERTDLSSARFNELSAKIKAAEKRLNEIAELKKHIINYSKTREVYVAYRKSGYSKKFFEEHREEITLHKAAKEAFSRLPDDRKINGKLPTVKQLSEEYAKVLADKKKAYAEYRVARDDMKTYVMARHNVDEFLAKAEKERKHPSRKDKHISR